MEVTNRSNNQSYLHHMSGNKGSQSMYPNQQEDFLSLIQKTIRMELNNQQYQTQQPTRNYYRRNRFDNYQVPNYNGNDGYHKNDYNDYNNFNGPRASNNYNRNNNRYNNRNNYNNDFNRNYNINDIRTNSDRNDTTNRSRFQPQNDNNQHLYAAVRPNHPPEVATAPYIIPVHTTQEKGKQPTQKRNITRKQAKASSSNQPAISSQPMVATQPAMMDTDLPILSEKPKKIRAKTKPLPIEYNIVSDVLQRKADITVGDLMIASPTIRRQLSSACKPKRITIQETDPKNTMALIEDEDINTTAVYSNVFIGDKNVKVLIDCGAAKTSYLLLEMELSNLHLE
ncbi:hypothetical protein G6F37_013073 [Rhizopus arrhizus]|nr:hypothetical protein G6F38_013007 [Rhizopus arrhizus]KAG1139926.1 hypothetical protein G6F37_013073 [Rhizopus arrhizus]